MSQNYESIFHDSVSILNAYNQDYSPDYQVEAYYKKHQVRKLQPYFLSYNE